MSRAWPRTTQIEMTTFALELYQITKCCCHGSRELGTKAGNDPGTKRDTNIGFTDIVDLAPLLFQDPSSTNEVRRCVFHRHGGQGRRRNLVPKPY